MIGMERKEAKPAGISQSNEWICIGLNSICINDQLGNIIGPQDVQFAFR